jgi:hypothetical protein
MFSIDEVLIMSIPKLKVATGKAEAFTAEAPDAKPAYKLRGKKQPLALNLPPDLIEAVDAAAAKEDRSRSKMIELLVRVGLRHRQITEAA